MSESGRSTVANLREKLSAVDIGAILLVPGILAAVFLVPHPIKREFVFIYSEPTVVTAFTSHFVHFTEGHLLANILGYLLIVTIAYAYAVLGDERRQFVSFFVAGMVGLPFAISALNVALVRPRVGYGFSAIVMAFLGFLPIAATAFIRARVSDRFRLDHAPLLFFAGLGIIAVQSIPGTVSYLVLLPILAIVAFYLVGFIDDVLRLGGTPVVGLVDPGGDFTLLVLGVVVFGGMPFLAFPSDPVQAGTITNLYSHMLGYSLGFIAPFVTFRLVEWYE